jgi:hypothetical protein
MAGEQHECFRQGKQLLFAQRDGLDRFLVSDGALELRPAETIYGGMTVRVATSDELIVLRALRKKGGGKVDG